MITWEEKKASEIAKAKADLTARSDIELLVTATLEWLFATQGGRNTRHEAILTHEATPTLSKILSEEGILAEGELQRLLGHQDGPIPSGHWPFAQLIGRAGAQYTASFLCQGQWREVNMCGLDSYGAWEAFQTELLVILRQDGGAQSGFWNAIQAHVKQATESPGQTCHIQHGAEDWIAEKIEAYQKHPDLEEAWETRLESYVLCPNSMISWLGRGLNPQKFMEITSQLPHPVFFNSGLTDEEVRQEGLIAPLIRFAPPAFDAGGQFLHEGMVIAHLLTMAGEYIRYCAGNGKTYPAPVTPEAQSALYAEADAAKRASIEILDALFNRKDAKPLAWAWLERLIREGEHRGYWRMSNSHGKGAATNCLYLLITELSGRIEISDIPPKHPETTPWKPIMGPMASLAVMGLRENPDSEALQRKIWHVLTVDCPEFHIGSRGEFFRAVEKPIGLIGAVCLLQMPDPGSFLKRCWHLLRPYRERSWHIDENARTTPNPGMPLILWGLMALYFAPEEKRSDLMASLEELLKDAWQTDARFSIRHEFWPDALEFFTIQWARYSPQGRKRTAQQIAEFLLSYLNGEYVLMRMISTLKREGIDMGTISQAVSTLGEKLPELAAEFLATHQYLISKHHWNPDWVVEIRTIALGGI